MIIVLKRDASDQDITHILDTVQGWGFDTNISRGVERTVIGIIGDESLLRNKPLEVFPGVESVLRVLKPYKLASREARADRTRIRIPPVTEGADPVEIGGQAVTVIAGPCSVENRDLLFEIAQFVKEHGAHVLRAGAFKPRTSPYSFQGLGAEGLRLLSEVRREVGLPVITEVMDTKDVDLVAETADILQIGARNMQNFNLLRAVGRIRKPVLIKRGMSATLEELLMSAEYVMCEGNHQVILCERGIRTFEPFTRNTVDISAVPVIRRESHLPVMVDPSHGTGHWDLVAPMAYAAVAAGADGIIVELHPRPEEALSDGPQALLPKRFAGMMEELGRLSPAVGRSL